METEDGVLYLDMKCGNLMQQRISRIQTDQAVEIARLIKQYITIGLYLFFWLSNILTIIISMYGFMCTYIYIMTLFYFRSKVKRTDSRSWSK